jgi:ribosomal protein S18 acetylase RimI-like enzyme
MSSSSTNFDTETSLQVKYAELVDTNFIIGLSARVQESLTSSGSLQVIGPLARTVVETSVTEEHAYLLLLNGQRIASVLVDPLGGTSPNTAEIQHVAWGVPSLPGPYWYMHALMLEPAEQGKHFGLTFLDKVLQLMKTKYQFGTVVLDCWAGNTKLRRFYEKVGFKYHGDFPENDWEISVYVITL